MDTPIYERPAVGFAEARMSLKTILDTSDRGWLTVIRRGSSAASVVNAEKFLEYLIRHAPANVQVVNEDGAWAMFMPGTPLAAKGTTLAEATADPADALRDYAEDWEDHLQAAPNHAGNWALVQIIESSTDQQLAEWLTGAAPWASPGAVISSPSVRAGRRSQERWIIGPDEQVCPAGTLNGQQGT